MALWKAACLACRPGADSMTDLMSSFDCDRRGEVAVAGVPVPEEQGPHAGVVGEVAGKLVDLGDGDAAVQVSPHVVRLRRRAVIDVAADVEVEVFPLQFVDRNQAGVLVELLAGCGRPG